MASTRSRSGGAAAMLRKLPANYPAKFSPTSPSSFASSKPPAAAALFARAAPPRFAVSGGDAKRPRKACMCSPTNHPGSFRCSLHKGKAAAGGGGEIGASRLSVRSSAMANSVVRIGAVEGEWVRRALAALVRPSSQQQRRRAAFRPRPSRLSAMSMAGDDKDDDEAKISRHES